ncbi:MAG TPA: pentapeptide repeat-containing protein [Ktedonobacteraceae bacterium]|nr:pentapeptide repeat-containing protein [Ktedonobacteraceae bacterium]
MVEQIIIIAIVGLLAACLGAWLALRFQSPYWKNVLAQHEGWEHAQQGHHRSWEEKQEKLIAEAEARFTAQVQQVRHDWHRWEEQDAERIAEQIQHQEISDEHARLERELARLPHIEETSMALDNRRNGHSQKQTSTHWRPASLQGANLVGLDLSHRYLGRADMRNAQLARTNLFMADLSGACLADADLSEADLSGANLANADLRGATLTGANLQVADLNNAILTDTNLQTARNLTTQQIYTAIYDSTTQLDPEIDITVPRTSSILSIQYEFPPTPPDTEKPAQNDAVFAEETESEVDMMFEETMPALAVVKLNVEQELTPAICLPEFDTTHEDTDVSYEEDVCYKEPEPDTTHEDTDVPYEELELLPSSQPEAENSQPSPEEIHPLVEIREDRYTKKLTKTSRKSKYNGRKRARVS